MFPNSKSVIKTPRIALAQTAQSAVCATGPGPSGHRKLKVAALIMSLKTKLPQRINWPDQVSCCIHGLLEMPGEKNALEPLKHLPKSEVKLENLGLECNLCNVCNNFCHFLLRYKEYDWKCLFHFKSNLTLCYFPEPEDKKLKSKKEKMKERRERWLNSEYLSVLALKEECTGYRRRVIIRKINDNRRFIQRRFIGGLSGGVQPETKHLRVRT